MAVQFVLHRRSMTAVVVLLLLAVAAVLAFVYLPHAIITVSPAVTARAITREILLSQSAKEPDFTHFVLPAKVVQKEVTAQQLVEREGVEQHDDFAKGTVILHNEQAEEQSLLPKTHLRHEQSGVFFLTDGPVRIPVQGTTSVSVTAKEKGAAGNVPAGKFVVDKLPASVQRVVFGTSDLPFSGGTVVDTPLSQSEIDAAKQKVLEQAKQQALGELTSLAGGASIRLELLTVQTKQDDVSAPAGSLASSFTVKTIVEAVGFVVDDNDLLGLTLLALRNQPQGDEQFVSYDPKSFGVSIIAADFGRGEARVQGKLTGQFTQKIPPAVVDTKPLVGLSATEVQERLKQFPGIGDVEVAFSPFWVRTVPSRPSAIQVIVKSLETTTR